MREQRLLFTLENASLHIVILVISRCPIMYTINLAPLEEATAYGLISSVLLGFHLIGEAARLHVAAQCIGQRWCVVLPCGGTI